jgi:predicted  nucleic acid-binding Zn-ribbon protein
MSTRTVSSRGAPPPLARRRPPSLRLGPRAFPTIVLTMILVSAAVLGRPSDGRAQSTATPPEVLAALLVEVKGLRAAMEQMAVAGPRVQLALGRLQLQEQRVNTLVRRLDDVKTSVVQAQKELEMLSQRMADLDRGSRETSDPEERRQAEAALKAMKTEMTRAALDVQRLQNEEAALSQDISGEQGRWTDLNRRLEELERSLGAR